MSVETVSVRSFGGKGSLRLTDRVVFCRKRRKEVFFDTRRIIETDRIFREFLRDPDLVAHARIRARVCGGEKRRFHSDGLRQIYLEPFPAFRPDRARDDDPSPVRLGETRSGKSL